MSEHTKGRLSVVEHSWSDTGLYIGGDQIALISIESEATEDNQDELEQIASANACRIAAAWNACEGLATEQLEALPEPFSGLVLGDFLRTCQELLAARALLREVVVGAYHIGASIESEEIDLCDWWERSKSYLDACDTLGGNSEVGS